MKTLIPAVLITVIWTLPAYAEVMDKEPQVSMVWAVAILCSVLGYIAARFKPALVVVTGTIAALFFGGVIADITDSTIGNAIVKEAGTSYSTDVYISVAVIIAAHAAGLFLRILHKQRANKSTISNL